MKAKESIANLRKLAIKDLIKQANDKRHELIKLSLDTEFGKNKNVARLGSLKKDIARIETVVNELIIKEGNNA